MKIEIGTDFPKYFKPLYREEFDLFAITTWKENGQPNVCFHSWSCFHGDKTAFFAVMGNLYQHTHTYANIQRDKCFCINFLPLSYYDKLVATIHHNNIEDDEFAVGNFTLSDAKSIHAPVIQEAFLNMECVLKDIQDLSGSGITSMVIGQVQHIYAVCAVDRHPSSPGDKANDLVTGHRVAALGKAHCHIVDPLDYDSAL